MTLSTQDPLFSDIDNSIATPVPMGVAAARDEIANYILGAAELSVRRPNDALYHLNTALWIAFQFMIQGTEPEVLGLDESMVGKLRTLKIRLT